MMTADPNSVHGLQPFPEPQEPPRQWVPTATSLEPHWSELDGPPMRSQFDSDENQAALAAQADPTDIDVGPEPDDGQPGRRPDRPGGATRRELQRGPVMSNEPNEFIRQEQQAAADEALREIAGVEPVAPPDDPQEEALFRAHMARFPGQHD